MYISWYEYSYNYDYYSRGTENRRCFEFHFTDHHRRHSWALCASTFLTWCMVASVTRDRLQNSQYSSKFLLKIVTSVTIVKHKEKFTPKNVSLWLTHFKFFSAQMLKYKKLVSCRYGK